MRSRRARRDVVRFPATLASTVAARTATYVVGAVISVVVARLLGPQERGIWAVALLLCGLAALIAELGLGTAMFFQARKDPPRRAAIRTVAFSLLTGSSLLAVVLGGLALHLGVLPLMGGIAPGIVLIALAGVPLANLIGLSRQVLLEDRDLWGAAAVPLMQSLTTLLLVGVGLALLDGGARGAVTLYVGSLGLSLAFATARLAKRGLMRPAWDSALVFPLVSFSLQAQLGFVALFLAYRLDLLLVNRMLGPAAAGIYSVALSLSEILRGLPEMGQAMIMARSSSVDMSLIPAVTRMVLLLTAVAALGGLILSQWLIPFLFGAPFAAAIVPFAALAPGILGLAVSYCISPHLVLAGRIRESTFAAVVSLVVMVILDLWLIPHWGILGAAIGSSVAYWVLALVQLRSVRALQPLSLRGIVPGKQEVADLARWLRRPSGR